MLTFFIVKIVIKKHFISLDTPRTVKLKAEYAKDKGLGGIFSWSGDQDNGLLANAAREGAGYLANEEVIDMGPLYNPGEECALTPVTNLRGRIYDVEVGQLKVDFVFDYHDVGNLSSKAYLRLYYAASPNGECIDSITLNYNKYHARSDLFFDGLLPDTDYFIKLEDNINSCIDVHPFSTR